MDFICWFQIWAQYVTILGIFWLFVFVVIFIRKTNLKVSSALDCKTFNWASKMQGEGGYSVYSGICACLLGCIFMKFDIYRWEGFLRWPNAPNLQSVYFGQKKQTNKHPIWPKFSVFLQKMVYWRVPKLWFFFGYSEWWFFGVRQAHPCTKFGWVHRLSNHISSSYINIYLLPSCFWSILPQIYQCAFCQVFISSPIFLRNQLI